MERSLLYSSIVGFNVANRNFMDLWHFYASMRFLVKHMDTSH